jgi:hypothetical protein
VKMGSRDMPTDRRDWLDRPQGYDVITAGDRTRCLFYCLPASGLFAELTFWSTPCPSARDTGGIEQVSAAVTFWNCIRTCSNDEALRPEDMEKLKSSSKILNPANL